jgi:hypothetical protein
MELPQGQPIAPEPEQGISNKLSEFSHFQAIDFA